MNDPRYLYQPYHVRCYRWWRYIAVYKFIVGPFYVLRWAVMGMKVEDFGGKMSLSRRRTAELVWRCAAARGSYKAQDYCTTEEFLEKL